MKGKGIRPPRPEEVKQKIRLSLVGKKFNEERRKAMSEGHKTDRALQAALDNLKLAVKANTGKPCSPEKRKQLSKSNTEAYRDPILRLQISERQKGEKSRLWKGGKTPENKRLRMTREFKEWRESVFERDGWACQQCGFHGKHLHPHHIKRFADFPALRFEVSNGITLCATCHQVEHKQLKLSEVSNG